MQKIKTYLNKVQIISAICSTIVIILTPILKKYELVAVGWFFISIHVFGDAMFIKKWGNDGITWFRRSDKNFKERLTRKYSDTTFYIITFLTMLLLIVTFFESFFYQNYIALLIAYTIAMLFLVILLIMTDRTNKQVLQLIPKKK